MPESVLPPRPVAAARRFTGLLTGLRTGSRWLLDQLLPPRCLLCGTDVTAPGSLCPGCWPALHFLAPPWCQQCGQPFPLPVPDGTRCAGCLAAPPPFARARAVFAYDLHSRSLLTRLKYADRPHLAPALAGWLLRVGAPLLAEADVMLPVPLPRRRLFFRRYNQAALLAQALFRLSGQPDLRLGLDWLIRTSTRPQAGLGLSARQRNVAGAFTLRPGRVAAVAGARLVLVDDVFTTGATVRECARVLLAAGAERVDVLTVARVLRSDL